MMQIKIESKVSSCPKLLLKKVKTSGKAQFLDDVDQLMNPLSLCKINKNKMLARRKKDAADSDMKNLF